MQLNRSEVIFNEQEHTYTLGGKELSGITSLLHRVLFPDMYSGVPEGALKAAAARGTLVHKMIEQYHTAGIDFGDEELSQYLSAVGDTAGDWLASEYLVSDNTRYASMIDLVFKHGDNFSLADIKTVSRMNNEYTDYCSWQLSVYAYLFEMQNPGCKVDELKVVWLPKEQYGKPSVIAVERKTEESLKALFEADADGLTMTAEPASTALQVSDELRQDAMALFMQISVIKKRFDDIKAQLLAIMQDEGVEEASLGPLLLKRKKAYTRESIDTTKLKKHEPEIAERYKKVTQVAESLSVSHI